MTIARLQSLAGGIDGSASSTNRTQQFTSPITAGSILIASYSTKDNNPASVSIHDDKSNTWIKLATVYESNSGRGVGAYYAVANAGSVGAQPIVTFDKGGTSFGIGTALLERGGVNAAILDGAVKTALGDNTSGPAEVAMDATSFTDDEILAFLCTEPTGWDTATAKSGYADVAANNSNSMSIQHKVASRLVTASGVYTPGWTLTRPDHWAVIGVSLKGSTTLPTIVSMSSATPRYNGSLTLTGVNFGATQGTGGVTIGGVPQNVTSWSDTSITVTVVRGTNKYGLALPTIVTVNGGTASNTSTLITGLLPQAGWDFVDLATPNSTVAWRATATPTDIAAADQSAWDTKSGLATLYADGTLRGDMSVTAFDVEDWSAGNGWGATGSQTRGAVTPVTLASVGGVPIASVASVGGVAKASILSVGGILK